MLEDETLPATSAGGPEPLRPGDVLAERYEVRELLGQGGMGRVFAAWDRLVGREVAIKLVRAGGELARLRDELVSVQEVVHRSW